MNVCKRLARKSGRYSVTARAMFTLAAAGLFVGVADAATSYYLRAYDTMVAGKRVPGWPATQVWNGADLDAERAQARECTITTSGIPAREPGWWEFPDRVSLPSVALAPGDKPIVLQLKDMKIGLYTFDIFGYMDAKGRKALERVWNPCPMEFVARNAQGQIVTRGRLLLKQSLGTWTPDHRTYGVRRMQGFHLHVDEPGNYTVSFQVLPTAMEMAIITRILLVDELEGLPDEAIKTDQNLDPGKGGQLQQLTEERKQRDDRIWDSLPPLNAQWQIHQPLRELSQPPAGVTLPHWHKKNPADPKDFAALEFINSDTGAVLPYDKIFNSEPWPGPYPDDGTGIFFSKEKYPDLPHSMYCIPRAILYRERHNGWMALLGMRGNNGLPAQYAETGDPSVGHDASLALIRLVYDWPAIEMNLHEIRLCTHSPDLEYKSDWDQPFRRNGKLHYEGWSGAETIRLFTAYDQLFPCIHGNQILADEVHRFIPWVKTPDDVVRLLDRYLIFASVRDVKRGLIGSENVEDTAAQVLGPHPLTAKWYDLTVQHAKIYPCEGTYQELYGTALSRSGSYYIASFMVYAFGDAGSTLSKAYLARRARERGVKCAMDLSDVHQYPKVRAAGNFLYNMWVAGGFPFMIGDASGGPHDGLEAATRLKLAQSAIRKAFYVYGDPKHAWILKNLCGDNSEAVAKAAEDVKDPILHAESHVVPDYGAVIECTPDEPDVLKKTAATLRLGIGRGHAHSDYLDVNFFAMGLPMAVDLACRNEGQFWSRPHAGWAFLHNHAIAHDSDDAARAGVQSGEPWLRAFAPPLVRARYVDEKGATRLDRDLLLMQVGDTKTNYAFDVQRLTGGKLHTWCFHGCESDDVHLNAPMEAKKVQWTQRQLDGTQKAGTAPAVLQATWEMTRAGKKYAYTFDKGGEITTCACEPTVLGARYDAKLPPVHVRATLLDHGGETVLQGNSYSSVYDYCFPFLWVQAEAKGTSVYPAVYEWYRGETPVIAKSEIVKKEPLTVRVTTTSGQVDEYTVTPEGFAAVSRDAQGVRWAKFSGLADFQADGLNWKADRAGYATRIAAMDYKARKLTTEEPLPENVGASVGNAGRQGYLALQGKGDSFTWQDDLLICEGRVTELKVVDPETILLKSNQEVLFGGAGNRKADAMTVTNEDGSWQFRGGKVIRKPAGAQLADKVFTDANGDGLIDVKTYEAGVGDTISVPADITISRSADGYDIRTNVRLEGTVGGTAFRLDPAAGVQKVQAR